MIRWSGLAALPLTSHHSLTTGYLVMTSHHCFVIRHSCFVIVCARQRVRHQMLTLLSVARTIGELSGRSNARWNSGMLDSGPLVRNCEGECGSTVRRYLVSSSRCFDFQIVA